MNNVANDLKNTRCKIYIGSTNGGTSLSFSYRNNNPSNTTTGRVPVLVVIGCQDGAKSAVIPVTLTSVSAHGPSTYPTGYSGVTGNGSLCTITIPASLWALFYVIYDPLSVSIGVS